MDEFMSIEALKKQTVYYQRQVSAQIGRRGDADPETERMFKHYRDRWRAAAELDQSK